MTLNTRKPTGAVPWPLVLIEGGEKTGKSFACAALSASPKVGRSLWLDLNEGAADEYGAVPGARYEVIEHDGSWASILGQVAAAKQEAARATAKGEKPVVLVVDSVTAEWDLLKDWASARAAQSKSNKKRLGDDPNAEVQVSMNLWNDATSRHRRLMTTLMTFPGIVVMTARGKDVASLDASGRPVEGTKEYKVEGHKTLGYDASVWVRLSRERAPVIVGSRSVHAGIRPGVDKPKEAPGFTLEWLIFDVLKCDPSKARVRDLVEARPERTPEQIRDEALLPATTPARIAELYEEARNSGCETVEFGEDGSAETLAQLLYRVGTERKNAETPAEPVPVTPAASSPADQPAGPDEGQDPLTGLTVEATSFADADAGRAAYRKVTARARDREITRDDAKRLHELIVARIGDMQQQGAEPVEGTVVAPLDPEDAWTAKVDTITCDEDAEAARADVRTGMQSGSIAQDYGDRVLSAIDIRAGQLAREGRAAA